MNIPTKPVIRQTLDAALGSYYSVGQPVPGAKCPECSADMNVATTTFTSKEEQKLITVYYLRCIKHPEEKHHGYSWRSRHCIRDRIYKKKKKDEKKSEMEKENIKKVGDGLKAEEIKPQPQPVPSGNPIIDAIEKLKNKLKTEYPDEFPDEKKEEAPPIDEESSEQIKPGSFEELVIKAVKPELKSLEKRIRNQEPTKIEHVWKNKEEIKAELKDAHHPVLPMMINLYNAGIRNFYLVGPAGTGKTTMAMMFAKAINKAFSINVCSYTQEREEMVGRIDLLNGGKYLSTDFVERFKDGGVCIIDEMDNGNPNTLASINTGLANNLLATPGGFVDRHADNVVVAIGNTYGNGQTRQYVGRNQLDAATVDRFMTLTVDYDVEFEAKTTGASKELIKEIQNLRTEANRANVRRVVGTRFLQRAIIIQGIHKSNPKETIGLLTGKLYENWTDDERRMCKLA